MSCCEPQGAVGKPNGRCPDCGVPTVDGESKEICERTPTYCHTCGDAPCEQAC